MHANRYGAGFIEVSLPNGHKTKKTGPGLLTITNEGDLVRRLQFSDTKAIESFYNLYFDRLYALVLDSVKRDRATAEEIVTYTFISAIRSVKSFKNQNKLYIWLVGIAYHKIMDYYRHEQQRNNHHVDTNADQVGLQLTADISRAIAASIETNETRPDVEKVLSSLPVDCQHILRFKYIEDMTISEISQVMNRSPQVVDRLLTQARDFFGEYTKRREQPVSKVRNLQGQVSRVPVETSPYEWTGDCELG